MNHKNSKNAWKRYGALFVAGLLTLGTVSGMTAFAEEEKEDQRITLRVADETEPEETETETETEEETEETEKETFAPLDIVETGEGMIVATDVSEIVENVMPAMVSITNRTTIQEYEDPDYGLEVIESEDAASGIVIAQTADELLIVTNSHVVADTTDTRVWFTVEAEDPETLGVPAKIKGMDKNYELAILAVQLSDIPEEILSQIRIATLGKSSELKVGQTAIAVGNALGLGQSVTCGVISALNREINMDHLEVPLILMDTPLNFGTSGGAVLNTKGEVIAICLAKEVGENSESMAYAIPIDEAIPVLENLANRETRDKLEDANRGYIGATVVNVNEDAKELYDMPEGAFVYSVNEGSAAEKAGIKKGDIITKFDGETVYGNDDLIEKISYYQVGETVTIEVQTANNGTYEAREVEVTLQEGAAAEEETEKQEDGEANEGSEPQKEEKKKDKKEDKEDKEREPDFSDDFGENDDFEDFDIFSELPSFFGQDNKY